MARGGLAVTLVACALLCATLAAGLREPDASAPQYIVPEAPFVPRPEERDADKEPPRVMQPVPEPEALRLKPPRVVDIIQIRPGVLQP
jgi:hypothetical protein